VKPFLDDVPVIDQFNEFIQSASCPVSLKIPYERMRYRHLKMLTTKKPVAGDMNESSTCGIDEDIVEMLQIAATFNARNSDDLSGTYTFEKGESYEWDRAPLPVRNQLFPDDPLSPPNSIFQQIAVSTNHHPLNHAKQQFFMDCYLFHPQMEAEDGKTWLVEHVEREELQTIRSSTEIRW
jgi:hypothetical protein